MTRKIAISDIHGCNKTFQKLLFETLNLQKNDQLYLLGDYIDRGPDSKGVLDTIQNLITNGYYVRCLLGNHEQLLLQAYNEPDSASLWLRNGGIQTLISFDVTSIASLPHEYISFISKMELYIDIPHYYLVHAGFNFTNGTNFLGDTTAMLWIRNWYKDVNYPLLRGKRIIHGHTPQSKYVLEKQMEITHIPNFPVNIDAGCVYKGKFDDAGHLCALNLSDGSVYFEPNIDM